MVIKRNTVLTLVLASLVALLITPALAQKGRSGGGFRRSGGWGSSRGRSNIGSRTGHRRGSHRGPAIGRRWGSNHRSSITHQRGSNHRSRSDQRKGLRQRSSIRLHAGAHRGSSVGHRSGFRHRSNIGHRSGFRRGSSIGRHKGLHHRSRVGHRKGSHHGFHGHHLFYYFSLPYRRYYYPYYYPYSYYYDSQVYREHEYRGDEYSSSQQLTEEEPYYDRFSDVREKVKAQQAEQTAQKEMVNRYLDNVVEAFATGDYAEAALRASDAVSAEPDDAVLPFVYTQSLFAHGRYTRAAAVLREALSSIDPDTQEIYYPLGLYPDENLLTEQIETLTSAVQAEPDNTDLQFLLGYQLLGADRLDQAREALQEAQNDYVNRDAAATLMEILERIRADDNEDAPAEK